MVADRSLLARNGQMRYGEAGPRLQQLVRREPMKRRPVRVWLGFALLLFAVALPVCANTNSDVRALFFQTSAVAAANEFNTGERVSLVTKVIAALRSVE